METPRRPARHGHRSYASTSHRLHSDIRILTPRPPINYEIPPEAASSSMQKKEPRLTEVTLLLLYS